MTKHRGTQSRLESIREALAQGQKQRDIAKQLGVTESAVSQQVKQLKQAAPAPAATGSSASTATGAPAVTGAASPAQQIDTAYENVELKLVQRLEQQLDTGFLAMSSKELLQAIRTINGTKRRTGAEGLPQGTNITQNNTMVSLQMPARIRHQVIKNVNNEIIEVDGKTLLTVDPTQLSRLNQERKDATDAQALLQYF